MSLIQFRAGRSSFTGRLNDDSIALAIVDALPMQSAAQRWGDELYFDVPVTRANTTPTRTVSIGDITYWPEGPCLCIFFGKTPASKGDEPRPASDVTIIGRTDAPIALLRSIVEGTPLIVEPVI